MRPEAEWWLAAGERDLTAAKVLLREGVFEAAAFHCQQAAEKMSSRRESRPAPAFKELGAFVARLRDRHRVRAVAVFGSRARGENVPDSDYDLAVVADSFENLNPLDRRLPLYDLWYESGPDADADIFALTSSELRQMDRLLIWDMLEDGRPIHDDGVWREARAEFERRKTSGYLTPVPGGWRVAGPRPSPGSATGRYHRAGRGARGAPSRPPGPPPRRRRGAGTTEPRTATPGARGRSSG